jgi:hypothetical protein
MSEPTKRRPSWIDAWMNTSADGYTYDDATIAHMRRFSRTRADVGAAMLRFPPHCVISFKVNDEITYGVVTGVCTIAPDKPPKAKRGRPDLIVALRFVPSPLHLAGATSPEERESAYVMPAGVDVVGYSPRYTPAIFRALVSPAGCA